MTAQFAPALGQRLGRPSIVTVIPSRRWLTTTVLALGLLLALATQMRLGSLPIGPGEVFLAASIGLLAIDACRGRSGATEPAFWILLAFWLVFVMAQCIGFIAGGLIGDLRDGGLMLHDAMTYPLLIAITLLSAAGGQPARRIGEIAWGFAICGVLLLGAQLAGGIGALPIPGVDPWYWDRFRGWTSNPNQFALLCLIVALVAFHLAETAGTNGSRLLAVVCGATAVGSGILAKTNAFTLALAVSVALFAGFKTLSVLGRTTRRRGLATAGAWLLVIGLPVLAISAIPIGKSLAEGTSLSSGFSRDDSEETGKEAKIRLELWQKALERVFETGFLGLGPGPHLPIPPALLQARWGEPFEPANVQHPTPGAAPNFEAHNSLLELFLQGGLLAVSAFVVTFALAVGFCVRSGRHALAAGLCGMLLFGNFHVITRHPAVWMAITMGLASRPAGADRRFALAQSHNRPSSVGRGSGNRLRG